MEKQKENHYQRKYKNAFNIVSEIGGFAFSLLLIGFIICSKLAELQMNKTIINEIFSFNKETKSGTRDKQQSNLSKNSRIKRNQAHIQNKLNVETSKEDYTFQEQLTKSRQNDIIIKDSQDALLSQNINQLKSESTSKQKQQPLDIQRNQINPNSNQRTHERIQIQNNSILNSSPDTENIYENKLKNDQCKTIDSIKLSFKEQLQYLLWPFGKIEEKKLLIEYSTNKLFHHLDIVQVIKKLLEVDKLKRMIFDQDQIELFEYFPKQSINIQDVLNMEEDQQNVNYESDILNQDNRTEKQKIQAAYQAFQNITQRRNCSQLDQKLLEDLDANIFELFTQNKDKLDVNKIQCFQSGNQSSNSNDMNNISSINKSNDDSLNLSNERDTQKQRLLKPFNIE